MSNNEPIVIKKYANRRLYNTATSAYIVVADIIAMVEDHVDFVVIDAKTGEDLTRAILNQVIFEQESATSGFMFPLEFQRQLIRMYSDNCKALLPAYLAQSLSYFTDQRDAIGQTMQETMAQNTNAMMEFSKAMARQNLSYYQHSMDMFRAFTRMNGAQDADQADAHSAEAGQASSSQDTAAPPAGAPGESPARQASGKQGAKPGSKPGSKAGRKSAKAADKASPDESQDHSQDLDAIKAQLLALQQKINDLTS